MGHFKFKGTMISIALLSTCLSIFGIYAGYFYMTGGISSDDDKFGADITEFEYPEWTVNFYTTGKTSATYTRDKELLASYTYTSLDEEFVFPDNTGTAYPELTFKQWSPSLIYVEGEFDLYGLSGYAAKTLEDLHGKQYYAGQTYKVGDIVWKSDYTLDLYEIVEEQHVYLQHDPELASRVSCDGPGFGLDHPTNSFASDLPIRQPNTWVYASLGDQIYGVKAAPTKAHGFLLQFDDPSVSLENKTDKERNPSFSYQDRLTYAPTKIVKHISPQQGTRITLDPERSSTENTEVPYYPTENPIKMYLMPGSSLYMSTESYTHTDKKGSGLNCTQCTYTHKVISCITVNDEYSSSETISLRKDSFLVDWTTYPNGYYIGTRWYHNYEYRTGCPCNANGTDHNETTGGGCVTRGTPILTADGTFVPVEDIKGGDEILVMNHDTGKVEAQPVLFNDYEPIDDYSVVELTFSNNEKINISYEHGFFDLNLNQYIYITDDNYEKFIGHTFYSIEDGAVTLVDATKETRFVDLYSPTTYKHLNLFTGSMLSMPGGIKGLFNIFEYETDSLKFDEIKKQKDIEQYGLFTLEDFEGLLSPEIFNAVQAQYLKVAMGKGLIDYERIAYLVERYGKFFN